MSSIWAISRERVGFIITKYPRHAQAFSEEGAESFEQ